MAFAPLPIHLEGFLKEADSRDAKKGTIHVVDNEGKSHTVILAPDMMSDIVKPLWESYVAIVGNYRKKQFHLTEIRPAKPKS
jgi:hypothetical protein